MNYTPAQITALKDERDALVAKVFNHYKSCGRCNDNWHSGESEICCPNWVVFDELESIDEALEFESTDYRSLSYYYDVSAINDTAPATPMSDLSAAYVTTFSERSGGSWAAQHLEPSYDTWSASQLLHEAHRPADDALRGPQDDAPVTEEAAWVEGELMNIVELINIRKADALFNAELRIYKTRTGEIGIFKTFISNVTDLTFTAYCAPCKKRLILDRTLKNVLVTVLHAHSHLNNSNVSGDESHLALTGSEATPEPGASKASDVNFVRRAGEWYMEQERVTAQLNGTYSLGPSRTFVAWREWLATL